MLLQSYSDFSKHIDISVAIFCIVSPKDLE